MVTTGYLNYPNQSCYNVSDPCWIPQAASIINKQVVSSLPQCDTREKYLCMLNSLTTAMDKAEINCKKSCSAESYTIQVVNNVLEPVYKVRGGKHKNMKSFLLMFIIEWKCLEELCGIDLQKLHYISLQTDSAL